MRVTDNEYADPAINEPKVTDPPEAIWLVYGDLERDDTHRECCASGEVTWCEDAQFAADVRYVRADIADAVSADIERLRAALAKAHAGLSCGMWDYGPGQDEHEQCDALIAEIDVVLGQGPNE